MHNPFLSALANIGIIASVIGTVMVLAAITIYWPDCPLCCQRLATRVRTLDTGRRRFVCGRCAKDVDFNARARARAWATREVLNARERNRRD